MERILMELLSRRKFIKAVGIAGGTTLMSGIVPIQEIHAATSGYTGFPDTLLRGVCDIHIHASPDTKNRLIDEFSFALPRKRRGIAPSCSNPTNGAATTEPISSARRCLTLNVSEACA